ncbi:carbamoyl phosphate synthase small subunit [uncultured Clostridium sp.]|jgi:carbamoyl-phosphate synthase small subunit|uniref:carbamoyl phosphate synthase small subunit n=1 Tax=uncultured Clostridium sp. TaxID=59620 RepID=UPI002629490E|nr:carbamoyl phosphate synthase small subunit [uncultured Clostridium sp.]
MKAKLILQDGTIFEGKAFGYLQETVGEVVFSTGMAGYQEIITDPSYKGQIVTMTYPLIGNYGVNLEDMESDNVQIKGLIVKEKCEFPNNFRCELELDNYLKQNKVLGLEGIDTRALTKILRNKGSMTGIIAVEDFRLSDIEDKIKSYNNSSAVSEVSTKESYVVRGAGKKVAVIDLGIKKSVLANIIKREADITVFPYDVTAETVLAANPEMVFLSNGPGNPADVKEVSEMIKGLFGKVKITGVGLGSQLIALALGAKTDKLAFGHRGSNHPVKDISNGKVYITTQTQGFTVSNLTKEMEITYRNINDSTAAGYKSESLNIEAVQFMPDRDSEFIYDGFMK